MNRTECVLGQDITQSSAGGEASWRKLADISHYAFAGTFLYW